MKHFGRFLLALFVLLSAIGCRMILYPAARAFGGAKESELKVCRQAFSEMKTNIKGGAIVVYPPMVVSFNGDPSWDSNSAAGPLEFLRREVSPSTVLSPEPPDVPYEPMLKNQLRYENQRARLYAAWFGEHHPAGDYFVIAEIVRDSTGNVILGGQIYIADSSGRIAYSHLYNTDWFDPASTPTIDSFLQWMLKRFLKDLEKEPTEIFPPFGVG